MPEGELSSWDYKDGCKAKGYLWNNKVLPDSGYQFSVVKRTSTSLEKIEQLEEIERNDIDTILKERQHVVIGSVNMCTQPGRRPCAAGQPPSKCVLSLWEHRCLELQRLEQKYGLSGVILKVDKNPLLYFQIPLYLSAGLPYYKRRTKKQTSPEFYKSRTHDLAA
ncbi:hypothetical protein BDN72DRAFT_865840 [Pluteus cervinus]|uniref:Uncharacterized protein n=1 Tax=Pluteus cervinus TaxID=181527 RepID=A0ACD2ZZ35_9AGAR|nr:hypothetical protein BDN72DRAFT_865840 [Pluteus cervinus]